MGLLNDAGDAPPQLVGRIPTAEEIAQYGNREDGTPKGAGFFGELRNPYHGENMVSGELSVTVDLDGTPVLIPTLVPGLSSREIHDTLKATDASEIPDAVIHKAIDHAVKRMRQGRSPFAEAGEVYPLPDR